MFTLLKEPEHWPTRSLRGFGWTRRSLIQDRITPSKRSRNSWRISDRTTVTAGFLGQQSPSPSTGRQGVDRHLASRSASTTSRTICSPTSSWPTLRSSTCEDEGCSEVSWHLFTSGDALIHRIKPSVCRINCFIVFFPSSDLTAISEGQFSQTLWEESVFLEDIFLKESVLLFWCLE